MDRKGNYNRKFNRKQRLIVLASLIAITFISVGFSVYTKTLNVTGNNVTVNAGTNPFTSSLVWNTTGPTNSTVTGGTWVFNELTINPSTSVQNITYTATITNGTSYNAYLSDATASANISCNEVTSGTTDATTLTNFCNAIDMTVKFGDTTIGTIDSSAHTLSGWTSDDYVTANGSKTVTVTIMMPGGVVYPDDKVKISLPNLTFTFTSVKPSSNNSGSGTSSGSSYNSAQYIITPGTYIAAGVDGLYAVDTTNLAQDIHGTNNEYTNTRYIGANPDNYVCFDDGSNGCLNYNTSTGVEPSAATGLFRIIGSFASDTHGVTNTKLVKVISADSYGNLAYDSNDANNWSTASLKTALNNLTDGYLASLPTTKIASINWHLGGYSTINEATSAFYDDERGAAVSSGNATIWEGRIGLMYPSDYRYATSGGTTYNRNNCLANYNLYNINSLPSYYDDCPGNDWLLYPGARTGTQEITRNNGQWTISPFSSSTDYVFYVKNGGIVSGDSASSYKVVRPAFYLESSVYVTGGSGTSTDPYRLAINS